MFGLPQVVSQRGALVMGFKGLSGAKFKRKRPEWQAALYEVQHGLCALCGQPLPRPGEQLPKSLREFRLSFDHILPWSKGGRSTIVNLQLTHHGCNTRRNNRDVTEEYVTLFSVRKETFPIPESRKVSVYMRSSLVSRSQRRRARQRYLAHLP